MKVDPSQSVGPIRPSSPFPFETDPTKQKPETFGELLKGAVERVNDLKIEADEKSFQLALGETKDIHDVMIAMEKADLALNLTLEIRDRLVEAYQSIMRSAM